MTQAEVYRDIAEDCECQAELATNPIICEQYKDFARQWREMADVIEGLGVQHSLPLDGDSTATRPRI